TLGQQLPTWNSANGAFVQDVLPRQHRTAERRLPQRVARALAVRDVQKRRRRTFAPASSEVCGAARAMVERGARADYETRELVPHSLQAGNPGIDLVDLCGHAHAQRL